MTTTLNRYLLILLILTAIITLAVSFHKLLDGLQERAAVKVDVAL